MRAIDLPRDSFVLDRHKNAYSQPIADALDALIGQSARTIAQALSVVCPTTAVTYAQNLASTVGQDYLSFIRGYHDPDSMDKNLLTGSPSYLMDCVREDKKKFECGRSKADKRTLSSCRRALREIFSYDGFRNGSALAVSSAKVISWVGSTRNWNSFEFLKALDVQVCPYCNADTVYAMELKDRKGVIFKLVRTALDHYYYRARFPYLGLSLYNLVPSCTRCNTSLKGKHYMSPNRFPHPYQDSVDDYWKFHVDPRKVGTISMDAPKGSFDLKLTQKGKGGVDVRKAKRFLMDVFHTEEVYWELFFREAASLIYRTRNLSQDVRALLARQCVGIDPDSMICGFALKPSSIHHHRLSKMTIDLVEEVKACRLAGA